MNVKKDDTGSLHRKKYENQLCLCEMRQVIFLLLFPRSYALEEFLKSL